MKKCPNCKLINPDEAESCDCGYNFIIGVATSENNINFKKRPVIASIFTGLLISNLFILLCTYFGIGFFLNIGRLFRGAIGALIFAFVSVASTIVLLIPTIISWIVYYRKISQFHSKSIQNGTDS